MVDNNFDFITNIEYIDAAFKTLTNIIDIIIKENKKIKQDLSLFKRLFRYPKYVNSIMNK